jgi:uridine kinase
MTEDVHQPALFEEPPPHLLDPVARVVLLCGPSGSGKTSLTRRLGVPVLSLDDFYRDGSDPCLPHRFGIVDWDDVASWDADAAMAALLRLCAEGSADVPVYDIPTSRRTGSTVLDLGDEPVVVAEGIFAAHLVERCRDAGILAAAVCLRLPAGVTFWRRLARDLGEARKPPLTLVRRGLALMREEPRLVQRWTALGCEPLSPADAEGTVRALLTPLRGPIGT